MMSETQPTPDDLGDELRALGATLKEMLQAAWESDERKRAQQEIESGLEDLARTLRSVGQEFAASPTGQRLKTDLQDLHERVRSGQVDEQVKRELAAALRRVNEELGKAVRGWGAPEGPPPQTDAGGGTSEEPS
jgi:hypothetical protein